MEVCESGGEQPPLLHWDRKLSELCEPADPDTLLSHTNMQMGLKWESSGCGHGSPLELIRGWTRPSWDGVFSDKCQI
ncbi:hypothetical protein BTVI_81742 [Pitangus sulphuratus]|nr:hypothetical protein BTVI_81742 [Pitangus sulphuratus]